MSLGEDKKTILSSVENIYLSIELPVILCDEAVKCVWKNQKARYMFNKVSLDLLLSEGDFNSIKKMIKENTPGTVEACFLPFFGCMINVMPIRYNKFLGAVLMFQVPLKEDEKEIFNKTDNMVALLSSNLRLPMHLITNAIDILNDDIEEFHENQRTKIKKSISVVENNTYKVYRVCKNLSELMRFSTDTNFLNKSIVKISDYINDLIDSCSEYIKLSGMNLVYNFSSLPGAASLMVLDCEKIDIAVSNIILNSCQYSLKNKNIFIDVVVSKYFLTIEITDEGFGISEDKIKDVFRPYKTLRNDHFVSQGMGIGLTLAKYITSQHDGTIEINSKKGVGTTVTINIPISCEIDGGVVQVYSRAIFKSKMSTVAIQLSPLLY